MDSSTTRLPFCKYGAMLRPVSMMNEMSGSRFLFRGVGTQMITASASRTRLKSLVAENVPAFTTSATASDGMCLM